MTQENVIRYASLYVLENWFLRFLNKVSPHGKRSAVLLRKGNNL